MTSLQDAIALIAKAPLVPSTRPPAITIVPAPVWLDASETLNPGSVLGQPVMMSELIDDGATAVVRVREAGAHLLHAHVLDLGLDSSTAADDAADAVVAGRAVAAIVPDTEGSARLAASNHGLVAFKPTLHTVPLDRWTTVSWTMDDIVPITRSVPDAALLLDVLTASGTRWQSVLPAEVPASRVGSLDLLADDDLDLALAAARVLSRAQAAQYHAELGTDLTQLPAPLRVELTLAATITADVYIRSLRLRHQLLERVTATFETIDVLELPTTPRTCAVASLLNLPAVTLPSGTQLVGGPGHDAHLLAAAHTHA